VFDARAVVPAPLTYDSYVLDAPAPGSAEPARAAPATSPRYTLPAAALASQSRSSAAARAPARRLGRARFANGAARPAAGLAAPRWRIVAAGDGAAAPPTPGAVTWSEQRAALAGLNRGGAAWLLVPSHELTA
jgi:hypothetical protein